MPSYTIYSEVTDGFLQSGENATYQATIDGSGSKTTGSYTLAIGQYYPGAGYIIYQSVTAFDTSVLSVPEVVTSSTLRLYCSYDLSTSADFDIEAYSYDWGEDREAADFRTSAQLVL